jgi:hypothetical protein
MCGHHQPSEILRRQNGPQWQLRREPLPTVIRLAAGALVEGAGRAAWVGLIEACGRLRIRSQTVWDAQRAVAAGPTGSFSSILGQPAAMP